MTNEDFEKLLSLSKKFAQDNVHLPLIGYNDVFDIISKETKDKFFLDIDRRGKIELSKLKIQTRYAVTKLPLVRIDVNSPPHINPDGTKTSRNHIHIYRQTEYDTGNLPWAYDLEEVFEFPNGMENINFMEVFYHFCEYCRIDTYNIQGVM